MLTGRKDDAGFTLTEVMVVVVILALLAAVSTPLLTRDNKARKGRDWAKIVAQTLQRARFQAMGDRSPVHVFLYRTRIDMRRQEPDNSLTLLASIRGPVADSEDNPTVAIWSVQENETVPTARTLNNDASPTTVPSPAAANDIIFTSLGGVAGSTDRFVFVRNELLPANHPDAFFRVSVRWLTGFVSSNEMVKSS